MSIYLLGVIKVVALARTIEEEQGRIYLPAL
jgi:hypothetical protein